VLEQYRLTRAQHLSRLAAYGLTSRDLSAVVPGRLSPWRERLGAAWRGLSGGNRRLERLEREMAALHSELDLWRLESEALERRVAGLSIEIQKKFSLPAACVVFVLIGAPLGMRVRRAGPAVAFVSVAFFLFYYLCLVGGEELATRLLLPPWLAMWLPNLVLGGWGLIATARSIEIWRPRVPAWGWSRAGAASPLGTRPGEGPAA